MMDNSPKVRALANLDVISPAPVHPPSPIIVPALQDQADAYFNTGPRRLLSAPSIVTSASGSQGMGSTNGIVEDAFGISDHDHQRGLQPNGSIQPSDVPTLVIDQQNMAHAHKDSAFLPHSAFDPSPAVQVPQGSSANWGGTRPVLQRSENRATQYNVPSTIGSLSMDLQAMVDRMSARDAASVSPMVSTNSPTDNDGPSQSIPLPPKPPVGQPNQYQPYALPVDESVPYAQESISSIALSFPSTNVTADSGGYRTASTSIYSFGSGPAPPIPSHTMTTTQPGANQSSSQPQSWERFIREERKHISDAKWDMFPDGSRLFVGNLFCECVSKRDVFNMFSKFGRLAQISLKSSYGFVQYYSVEDGQAAMDNLQGIEVQGKRLNLEVSRPPKRDKDGHRNNRTKRECNRQNSNQAWRDDRREARRPNKQPSPARGYQFQEASSGDHERGRSYQDSYQYSSRRRSLSPSYQSQDPYRRRTPSPHHRYLTEADLDLPRRAGADVPDIQFLLHEEVRRDFVTYVRGIFERVGLKVSLMSLSYQFPREAVIQRQVREGVHAIVELDYHAERLCKIQLQTFDRSAGFANVRFDEYQDLDPEIAAQLVLRAKSLSCTSSSPLGQHAYPQMHYTGPGQQNQYIPPPTHGSGISDTPVLNGYRGGPQVDINAVLAALQHAVPNGMGPSTHLTTSYNHPAANTMAGNQYASNVSRQVENIMEQLGRFRR